jgi:hypothetical protein
MSSVPFRVPARTALCSLALVAFSSASAEAACTWQVSGQIVRSDPMMLANGLLTEPGGPVEVMAMARWTGGCPGGFCQWNTSNWLPTTSDGDGNFTITSLPLPDPSCQINRDFIVLYRAPGLGVSHWQTTDISSNNSGPNQLSGPTPFSTFTHTTSLGPLKADDLGMPPWGELPPEDTSTGRGVPSGVETQPMPGNPGLPTGEMGTMPDNPGLPTGEMGPAPGGGAPDPEDDNPDPDEGGSEPNLPSGTLQPNPCGIFRNNQIGQPDFAYAQHPMAGGQAVTDDGQIRIARRQNAAGQGMARRVNATFLVANNGQRDHAGDTDACSVTVEVRFNEGPDEMGDPTNWHSYVEHLPSIPVGFPRLVTVQGTLRGTGNDTQSDWNEDYRYVVIYIVLDNAKTVFEANELDNPAGRYCYDAIDANFVPMSTCVDAQSERGN